NAAQASSSGGWSVAAAFYAFWEPLFAWGVILSLLVFFQRRFVALGPAWQKLARRALSHLHHPPADPGRRVAGDARPRRRRWSSSRSRARRPALSASSPSERCWQSRSSGASSSGALSGMTRRPGRRGTDRTRV